MYILLRCNLRVLKPRALLPVRSNQLFQHNGFSILYFGYIKWWQEEVKCTGFQLIHKIYRTKGTKIFLIGILVNHSPTDPQLNWQIQVCSSLGHRAARFGDADRLCTLPGRVGHIQPCPRNTWSRSNSQFGAKHFLQTLHPRESCHLLTVLQIAVFSSLRSAEKAASAFTHFFLMFCYKHLSYSKSSSWGETQNDH